ncbi:MAG: SpaA isopeptide-forming pilin-related protein, partial [Lachnospiraceae bacterium]
QIEGQPSDKDTQIEGQPSDKDTQIEGQPSDQDTVTEEQPKDKETVTEGPLPPKDTTTEEHTKKPVGALERLRSMFQSVTSFFTGSTKAIDFTGGTSSKYTFYSKDLPEGFNTVTLEVVSQKDGYDKNSANKKIKMAYDVTMNEDFLYAKSEEFMTDPTFPNQGSMNEADWMKKVVTWLTNQPANKVPPLVYTYPLDDMISSSFTIAKRDLKDTNGIVIGSYEVNKNQLTVTMNPQLYFMSNISFAFSFEAELDPAKLPSKPSNVITNGQGKLLFQEVATVPGGGGAVTPKYTLDKEAPVSVGDTQIAYTLKLNAQDPEVLNGKTLVDKMPSIQVGQGAEAKTYKLKVKSVTMTKLNGVNKNNQINDATDVSGDIAYTFQALEAGPNPTNKITSAELKLVLELDGNSYQNLITKGGINQVFTNQAQLAEQGQTKPLVESKEVKTQMRVNFIGKKGKATNLEGTKYAWTIDLNTKLPSMEYGYLVDSLRWTDHTYETDDAGNVTYTINGTSKTAKKVEFTSPTAWKNLTADALHTLIASNSIGDGESFYYVYDEVDNSGNKISNPFYDAISNPDVSQYVQRAILVIPYLGYQGTDTSKAVIVKYNTNMNLNGLSSQDYLDKLKANTSYKQQIKNDVNLLWKNQNGVGPGPISQDLVNFGKTVDTNVDAVHKKGVSYNDKTHMAEWSIDVNKLGFDLTEVVLTDSLLDSQNKAMYDTSKMKITCYRNSSKDQTKTLVTAPEWNTYTAAPSDLGNALGAWINGNELKIYLGNMPGKKEALDGYSFYTLSIQAPLTNEGVLAQQSKNKTITNTMNLSGKQNGTSYIGTSTAEITTPNTLIEKAIVGNYDYQSHELQWKVTVNPNGVNIKEAKVKDTITTGFDFGALKKVEVDGVADSTVFDNLKNTTATSDATGTSITWELGDIGTKSYTLYFTTKSTDDWRNTNLKCATDKNGVVTGPNEIDVPNQVQLTGKVGNTSIDESAKAEAVHKIEKKPMSKKGETQYDKNGKATGEIKWTVVVNEDQYNISGLYLTETLSEIQELDPDSIKVFTVGTNTGGTIQDTDVTTAVTNNITELPEPSPGTGTLPMTQGFKFTFPTDVNGNYSTYKLKFSTWLTKEASGANISNQVYLPYNNGEGEEISKPNDGGFNGTFNFEDAAKASPRPKIAMRKISSNSSDTSTGKPGDSLGLEGTFVLEGYTYTYDSSTKEVTLMTSNPKYNKTRTVTNGDAVLLNINPNDDLVYMLHEKSAKNGYDKSTSTPYFLYFVNENARITGDVSTIKVPKSGESGTNDYTHSAAKPIFTKYTKDKDGIYNNGKLDTVVFTNTPNTNSLTFTKQQVKASTYCDSDASGASNVTEYEAAKDVVFKVEPQGELKDKLKTFYTTASNDKGEITLKNLDPGTYQLTEVKSNTKFVSGGSVELKVEVDAGGTNYSYTFSKGTGGITIDANTILKDDLLRGNVTFTKKVKYTTGEWNASSKGEEPLSGVTFLLEGQTEGVISENYVQTVTSNAAGEVKFQNIPVGTYTISETQALGYDRGTTKTKVYDITVTEETTNTVLGTDNSNPSSPVIYNGKQAKVTATPVVAHTDDTANTVYNTAIKGKVSFTKKLSEANLSDLNDQIIAGAEFGLFRKIGTTVAAQASYTATSDTNGKVEFTDVEYGDYVLKETKVPVGYVNSNPNGIPITKANLATAFDSATLPTTFTYTVNQTGETQGIVRNTLYKTTVNFKKEDTDKNPMSGITFDVYRKNTGVIGNNGSGLIADATGNAYYRYTPQQTITSAASTGVFTLTNVPYGDYLLVEQDVVGLQETYSKVALSVSITNTSVTVKQIDNFTTTVESGDYYSNITTSGTGWNTISPESQNYRIVNHKQYGYIQLQKKAAERKTDSNKNVTLDVANGKNLAGATFEIKKDGNHYLTLTTGTDGKLPTPDQDGAYTDEQTKTKKHLFYGSYTIEETKVPQGIQLNSEVIPFDMVSGGTPLTETTGHEGTAYIALTGISGAANSGAVTYVTKGGQAPTDCYVVNEILRGNLILKKENLKNELLSDAEFLVYPRNGATPVASLQEIVQTGTKTGTYRLDNTAPNGVTFTTDNDAGYPYLYQDNGEWHLLAGAYEIKETKAPVGYEKPAASLPITVLANTQNTVTMTNSPITLTVEKTNSDWSTVLLGAEFSITPVSGSHFLDGSTAEQSLTTVQNVSTITGLLANNSYVLKETKAPDGYVYSDAEVTFQVEENGTFTITENTQNAGQLKSGNARIIQFKDNSIDITLKKQDIENANTLIGNVTFDVYDVTNGGAGTKVETVTTGTSGSDLGILKFTKLVIGHQYELKETAAPLQYQLRKDNITFKVKVDGSLSDVTNATVNGTTTLLVTNQQLTVGLQKKSSVGNVILTGGTYTITPDTGSSFTGSSTTAISVTETTMQQQLKGKLQRGDTYVLKEITAPQGYELAEEVKFKVNDDGHQITILQGKNIATVAAGTDAGEIAKISLQDTPIEAGIQKTDENGKLLTGAEFTVTAESGSAFAKNSEETAAPTELILTDNTATGLHARLIAGNTYRVTETQEPLGYIRLKEAVTFTVKADGTLQITKDPQSAGSLDSTNTMLSLANKKTKLFLDKVSNEKNQSGQEVKVSGAILEIKQADGSPVTGGNYTYVTAGAPIEVTGLLAGAYQLVETKTPKEYCTAAPIPFILAYDNSITVDGTVVNPDAQGITTLSMTDVVIRAQVVLTKERKGDTTTPLQGATFDLYRQVGKEVDLNTDTKVAVDL